MRIVCLFVAVAFWPLVAFGQSGPKFDGSTMRLYSLSDEGFKVAVSEERNYSLESEKNAGVAFVLSFILPSGGQFYNGERKKGFVILGGGSLGGILALAEATETAVKRVDAVLTEIETGKMDDGGSDSGSEKIGLAEAVFAGFWLWSVIDAPISANKINKKIRAAKRKALYYLGNPEFKLSASPMYSRSALGAKVSIAY